MSSEINVAETQRNIFYKNNPKLKAAGVKMYFEPWQVQELAKCLDDPIYLIKNYIKIVHVDKGIINFDLYDYQEKMINLILNNRFTIMKLPRQTGKTTTIAGGICKYLLFEEHKTVAILANKAATAREILSRIQLMYENLPMWMQPGVKVWNKGSIELGNGCKVIAASTSSSAIRGCLHGETTIQLKTPEGKEIQTTLRDAFELLVKKTDDVSENKGYKILAPSGWADFDGIVRYRQNLLVHIHLENGKIIKTSRRHPLFTTEGWKDARFIKPGMKLITQDNQVVTVEKVNTVRASCFTYDIIAVKRGDLGDICYTLSEGALVEKRSGRFLEGEIDGNVSAHCFYANGLVSSNTSISWLVLDEFAFVPSNQAVEFFESVYPTISSGAESKVTIASTPKGMNHFYKMWVDAVEGRSEFVPFEIHWSDVPGRDEEWKKKTIANIGEESWLQEFEAEFLGSSNTLLSSSFLKTMVFKTPLVQSESLLIYEEPKKDRTYFIGVDPARGTGNDYSVAQVIDITEYPYKQVAVFRNNKINHISFSKILVELAKKYNEAYMLIELNDIGESVADLIYFDEEYENILPTSSKGRTVTLGFGQGSKNGVRMTKTVKNKGCTNLKMLIENNKLLIQDYTTINELSKFVSKGFSYEAEEGANDDTVMALVIFAWAASQEYFQDLTSSSDLRKSILSDHIDDILEDLAPLGVIPGMEDEDDMPGWEEVSDTSRSNDSSYWESF